MEKLNDYLQRLLSSCSDELRLEPNKAPYLVADNRTTDVSTSPLLGTQISTMVFPLIPTDLVTTLPSREEVEFVLPHNLGNFNFSIQKSPAGFVVTIRPLMGDTDAASISRPVPELPPEPPKYYPQSEPELQASSISTGPEIIPDLNEIRETAREYVPTPEPPPSFEQITYELESVAAEYENSGIDQPAIQTLDDLLAEERDSAGEYVHSFDAEKVEVVSANDPEFQTVFSDTSDYEPPARKSEMYTVEYAPPPVFTAPGPQPESRHSSDALNLGSTAQMDELFTKMEAMGASDLHLSVSMPPMVRKDGKMKPLEAGRPALTDEAMKALLNSIMPAKNREEFAVRNDTDFAYEIPGLARFRCNVFRDRKGMGGVFRIIPTKILTAEQLGLSKAIMDLCSLSKGLVVVTGPTGSGKSTTLCAMIDAINKDREDHIITIEDPIEFVHENQKCLVNQREVHNHTDSFKDALRAALREDPDILLVGEMRDLETISIAIETAETGHLVFGTLHTTTAASTVDRIIDQFPADRQQQIRVMLSESLKGVIAQTLLPKKGGGRVAALEVLIVTPAISNLIREGKTFQIPSAMQTGKNHGMVMLNDALYAHVQAGTVEPRDAYIKAVDKAGFETMLTRGGFKL